jgi:hypothetical protein
MKKVFSTLFAAGIIALVACGPSADQKSAEQMAADSIAAADSMAAAAAAEAAAMVDTTAAMDTTAAAPAEAK